MAGDAFHEEPAAIRWDRRGALLGDLLEKGGRRAFESRNEIGHAESKPNWARGSRGRQTCLCWQRSDAQVGGCGEQETARDAEHNTADEEEGRVVGDKGKQRFHGRTFLMGSSMPPKSGSEEVLCPEDRTEGVNSLKPIREHNAERQLNCQFLFI